MKKRRGRVFFIALGCSILFIIFFPREYTPETYFTGSWDIPISSGFSDIPEEKRDMLVPFQSKSHFGYVTADGEVVTIERIFYNVSFSENYYINYASVTENLFIKNVSGEIVEVVPTTGYPLFIHNRMFIVDKDRCGISEWDIDGNRLWERRFSSLITAFGCNEECVALGFLNGEILLLDGERREIFRDIPTGSRIRIIYGLAVAPGEEYFAVIMGIDPQRLVIYRKDETGYRPYHSEELKGDSRRETFIQFTDEHTLFYEQPSSLVQYDIPRKESRSFPTAGTPRKIIINEQKRLLMFHHAGEGQGTFDIYTASGMPLSHFQLPQNAYVHFLKGSLFFTVGDRVKKIDMRGGEN